MFLAMIADAKTAASWGERREEKLQKLTLSPLLDGNTIVRTNLEQKSPRVV